MKSKILVFLLVLSFMLLGATSSVFAAPVNVYLGGLGPYTYPAYYTDAEKNSGSADNNYCWSAAASNVLAWTGWDAGFSSEDNIFANFQTNWTGDHGSWARFGLEWWFTGGVDPTDLGWIGLQAGGSDDYTGGGGHYTQAEYNSNVRIWEDLSTPTDVTDANVEIKNFIDDGYATTLGLIKGQEDKAHAVTMWGYQWDNANPDYLAIWISDSDDSEGSSSPVPNNLWPFELTYNYNWGWYLNDYWGTNDYWIATMAGLLPYDEEPGPGPGEPVPEPATIFLLGSGLVGLFGIGRKKFKKG